jgi:tetratricopeptide (TPR) repeat protein
MPATLLPTTPMTLLNVLRRSLAVCLLGASSMLAIAAPITPTRDDEVVDVLPAVNGNRTEARRLRRQLAEQPSDPVLALAVAKRYLDQAHALGDPRFAGMAISAIAAWRDDATAPDDILLMRATLQQYLHEFDAAAMSLQRLLARPGAPRPQAGLTLATVRRVQGRYADSDAACQGVAAAGAALHASACLAENAALRGELAQARVVFERLLGGSRNPPATQAWLTTSLAELEQRAGRAGAAEAAFKAALRLDPDAYTALAYADFLIEQKRPAEALVALKREPRSDAVLLRLAIAGTAARADSAAADVAEMRERIALANQRPDAKVFHGREQAMFALAVDRDAPRALELARGNVVQQREPLDLLVFAQAARASGRAEAIAEVKRLARSQGLVDRRTEGLF